jgi:hypothetical protein
MNNHLQVNNNQIPMPQCEWCKTVVKSYDDHQNFMGAYTCEKNYLNYFYGGANYNNITTITAPTATTTTTTTNTIYDVKSKKISTIDTRNMRLYHQTSKSKADNILAENRFRIGYGGLLGPAIYFATTPEDTHHKAMNTGVILECIVDLGRVLTIVQNGCDCTLNGDKVAAQGYDSVFAPRDRGDEYAVYDPSRIKSIALFQSWY